jgi:hypothetical protein
MKTYISNLVRSKAYAIFTKVSLPGKLKVIHMCVKCIDFASISTIYDDILELFRQCGIFGISL